MAFFHFRDPMWSTFSRPETASVNYIHVKSHSRRFCRVPDPPKCRKFIPNLTKIQSKRFLGKLSKFRHPNLPFLIENNTQKHCENFDKIWQIKLKKQAIRKCCLCENHCIYCVERRSPKVLRSGRRSTKRGKTY